MQLQKYLDRIGLTLPLPANAETLRRVHVAHLAAFTFDNMEIQRHGAIRVDPASVEQKFLERSGGGYCFEHNTLLAEVLTELGFNVTKALGRVGPPDRRSLNHMLLIVDLDGEKWLADVGFGAEGPLEPIRLKDGERKTESGITYALQRGPHYWTLTMEYGSTTEELYEFSDAPHTAGDIEIASYYASTYPESIFRHTFTIQRSTADERVILRPTVVTRYREGVRTDTPIEPHQIRALAKDLFGIEVGEEPLLFEKSE